MSTEKKESSQQTMSTLAANWKAANIQLLQGNPQGPGRELVVKQIRARSQFIDAMIAEAESIDAGGTKEQCKDDESENEIPDTIDDLFKGMERATELEIKVEDLQSKLNMAEQALDQEKDVSLACQSNSQKLEEMAINLNSKWRGIAKSAALKNGTPMEMNDFVDEKQTEMLKELMNEYANTWTVVDCISQMSANENKEKHRTKMKERFQKTENKGSEILQKWTKKKDK